MIAAIVISILSIIGMISLVLFFPVIKIKKIQIQTFWFAPLIGSILLLSFGLVDSNLVFSSLIAPTSVNPLEILAIFISMVFISVVLDEVGFFKYLASVAVKKAKNSQLSMFILLYFVASILTIFTSNDIIVITFTPFIIFFCKNTKINPLPYLVGEFVGANTWSMLLIIGNPTNIYLASSFNIDFLEYITYMALPTIFAGLTSLGVMLLLFRKCFKVPLANTLEEDHILDKKIFIVSLVLLISCIILLSISSWVGLKMWIIAFVSGCSLLIFIIVYCFFKRQEMFILKESISRIPLNLIPLLLSMFVIVLTLHSYDISKYIFDLLNSNNLILTYGTSGFVIANLINNIPMSVLYVDIIENFEVVSKEAIFASIISSNISAFFTPIGALAGMMWMGILKKNNVPFSFGKFCLYGVIISVPTLFASLGGLYLSFLI